MPPKNAANKKPDDDDDDDAPAAGEGLEIEVPEEDDDDDKEEPKGTTPAERETRRARRSNRVKGFEDRATAAEARAAAAEAGLAEQRELLQRLEVSQAELRGRVSATGGDPERAKVDDLRKKGRLALARADEAKSAVEATAAMDDYDNIQEQIMDLRVEQKLKTQKAPSPEDYSKAALRAEFPWIGSNDKASRWAGGMYEQLVADGKEDNHATAREAAAMAAKKFGLGPQPTSPAPTAREQRAYEGVPSRSITGPTAKGGRVVLTPQEQRMALARWPDLDDDKAMQNMAKLLRSKGLR